jgi:hypothetical protein
MDEKFVTPKKRKAKKRHERTPEPLRKFLL